MVLTVAPTVKLSIQQVRERKGAGDGEGGGLEREEGGSKRVAFSRSNHFFPALYRLHTQPFQLRRRPSQLLMPNLAMSRTRMPEIMLTSAPISLSTTRSKSSTACTSKICQTSKSSAPRMTLEGILSKQKVREIRMWEGGGRRWRWERKETKLCMRAYQS